MKHIHIALVLLVCSFITLSFAKNTLVYRRYHRKRPSSRKAVKNVVEIVEVFKTNRKPPSFMKSDKSIEKFLLCDAKCERKRFLKRRKMCLRTGKFCPTRPSGSQSTTQINVSTRPIYKKPTVYPQNPYGNRNPDYTHLYPWSRPSVTVTKYQPDRSKDFNMTIVEVNNDTVVTTAKYDYEYYDGENEHNDRQQQRRSTTFKVPTTTWEWTTPVISTIKTTETTSTISPTTVADIIAETSTPTTTNVISTTSTETSTLTEPPETTEARTVLTTTELITSTLATTPEIISSTTEYWTTLRAEPEPVNITELTTEFSFPAPPTPITIFDSSTTTAATIEIPTTEIQLTSTFREETTEAASTSTSTSTTTEISTTPITTQLSPTTTSTLSTSTTNEADVANTFIIVPTTSPSLTTENQTEATNTEQEVDDGEEYVEAYDEGEEEEGDEEGVEDEGEEENGQVDGENGNDGAYDYDDDGNYDDEDQTEDLT